MGFGEDGLLQVRKDLLQELHAHIDHYKSLFGGQERVDELTTTLAYFESNAGYSHWMTMLDMGRTILSFYNVVLFHLSSQQCFTSLPLMTIPMPIASRKEICIGFVNNNHFVQVFLVHGHLVPPIATNWRRYHLPACQFSEGEDEGEGEGDKSNFLQWIIAVPIESVVSVESDVPVGSVVLHLCAGPPIIVSLV
ncbi:uncharacterized protein LOC114284416 [Camellia sinensis]|uniref:uncharacterized protein LOC114284416 n=1 Tax=Camellia sinensis TaxID=4442 RepID=UPI001036EAE9|nr:uncharacterized protein LOC114284416 [Camellia sinensis]